MGTGRQREIDCSDSCEDGSPAFGQKLLAPNALASSPDGSVFVADFDKIRKIFADGTVSTVLQLR